MLAFRIKMRITLKDDQLRQQNCAPDLFETSDLLIVAERFSFSISESVACVLACKVEFLYKYYSLN